MHFFCTFFQKKLVMYSGYALAFYDAVVSSDAALVLNCTQKVRYKTTCRLWSIR